MAGVPAAAAAAAVAAVQAAVAQVAAAAAAAAVVQAAVAQLRAGPGPETAAVVEGLLQAMALAHRRLLCEVAAAGLVHQQAIRIGAGRSASGAIVG